MKFSETKLPDVIRIVPTIHEDPRGYFVELWQSRKLVDAGINAEFVQENFSRSSKGTLRGLHYQIEHAQGRLVRVIEGEVYDVTVDLRRSSPNFGRWTGETLSAENRHQLWIPPGFAHGFIVMSEFAGFQYNCTDYYSPESDRSLRWNDPDIAIEWPFDTSVEPTLSERDANAPFLADADTYA